MQYSTRFCKQIPENLQGEDVMIPENAIYIVGNAKAGQNNPITHQFKHFFIGIVVERETGAIFRCGASATIAITSEFIDSLFAGRSLRDDAEVIREQVERRYFGSSQKAILVAFRDAQRKFLRIQAGLPVDVSD